MLLTTKGSWRTLDTILFPFTKTEVVALCEKLQLLLVGENKMRKNWTQIFKKRKVESGVKLFWVG